MGGERAPWSDLSLRDGVLHARLDPEQAHRLCAGHFPGNPLLPGSTLAGLMAMLAARLLGSNARVAALERCVFRSPVRPDRKITVSARRTGPGRVEAEVRNEGRPAARAWLVFTERA